jgi:hypothetical protein
MKNKPSHRAPGLKASIAGLFLLMLAGALGAAIEPPNLEDEKDSLKKAEWKVIGVLIKTYGATDWSQVTDHLESYPDDAGNPNVMVIPISLGNAYQPLRGDWKRQRLREGAPVFRAGGR